MAQAAPRYQKPLMLGLMLLALLALGLALRDRQRADLREVTANVDFMRGLILSLEDAQGQAPMPCGYESWAWEALVAQSEIMGDCGRAYMGRMEEGRGRYWISVAPGGVDFEVNGLARRGRSVLRVSADRAHAARVVDEIQQ